MRRCFLGTMASHIAAKRSGLPCGACVSRQGWAQVCVHSLRGLYATLAVESGAISETVAKSLGHSSFNMTERHYAQPSAVSNSRSARVEGVQEK